MEKNDATSVVFDKVSKRYDKTTVVDEISFTIQSGELVTLLGPSGCGKTTTLRMIAGLELVSSGRVFIGGKEVTNTAAADRNVAMVFQSYALFPHMTILENVSYGLKVSAVPKAEAIEAAENGLELVGLKGYGNRYPNALSGGQQQRVAIARSIVIKPQVLLFDEPLSNLDAKLRRQVREEIRDLQQRLSLTTAYVTHDQEEALALSDQIIVLESGQIAQKGTPHELYDAPENLFVADFIGNANVVDAEFVSRHDDLARVNIGGVKLDLPHRNQTPGQVKVAIRPSSIVMRPSNNDNLLDASVLKTTYLGGHMEYVLDTVLGELFVVDYQVKHAILQGTNIRIGLGKDGVALVSS
ncbi:MAG: ABC transporter ATP-binding protein [Gammaproteobacteria bacterium]|nr:ABC transporter ATP-binding protein [Gammaproteobacteria bacterium]